MQFGFAWEIFAFRSYSNQYKHTSCKGEDPIEQMLH